MIPFVPLFFFASMYAQISLGESASETGLYLLIFFAGFATASQWGGKMLDRIGARRPVVLGCAVAAVGFYLWGDSLTELSVGDQWYYIVLAGAGVGLVLSPANTDALNRVPRRPLRRGDRDHPDGAQLRLQPRAGRARLGPDPREPLQPRSDRRQARRSEGSRQRNRRRDQPGQRRRRSARNTCPAQRRRRSSTRSPTTSPMASRTVFYGMAAVMAVAFVIALVAMPAGKVETEVEDFGEPTSAGPA